MKALARAASLPIFRYRILLFDKISFSIVYIQSPLQGRIILIKFITTSAYVQIHISVTISIKKFSSNIFSRRIFKKCRLIFLTECTICILNK